LISSEWEIVEGMMRMNVTIPTNTSAVVTLPGAVLGQVKETGIPVSRAQGVTRAAQADNDVCIEAGSGEYHFAYPIG
jgi:alpha-L-rhamnosidase